MKKEEGTAPIGVSQGEVQVTGRHGWGHQEGGRAGARTRVRRSSQEGKQGRQGDGGGSTRTLCPSVAAVVITMNLNFAVILPHLSEQTYCHVLPVAAHSHSERKACCYLLPPVRITVLAMCCLQLSMVLLGHGGRYAAHPHIIGLPFVGGRGTAVPCARLARQVRLGMQRLG